MGNITSGFAYALMLSIAKQIAVQAQTDKQGASNYFDMHAESMNSQEREQFGNAVVAAAIKIRS
jgi:hypothetical protein